MLFFCLLLVYIFSCFVVVVDVVVVVVVVVCYRVKSNQNIAFESRRLMFWN